MPDSAAYQARDVSSRGEVTRTAAGALTSSSATGLATLRLLTSIYCACAGALMLVVPHRFTGPAFALLRPYLMPVAITLFVLGSALIVAAAFVPNSPLLFGLQALVGAAWLLLAAGFVHTGNWVGATRLVVFGLGTLAAPLLLGLLARRRHGACDLFALLLGVATAITGAPLVAGAARWSTAADPAIVGVGAAFCVAGVALVAVQLIGPSSMTANWTARFAVAAALLGFLVVSPLPSQSWLGPMYYAGFGTALIVGPVLALLRPAARPTPGAQLAVALMLAAAIPLVATVTIISNGQQDLVTALSLRSWQTLAAVLADDVASFAQANRAIVTSIASTPYLVEMTPAEQAQLLRDYQRLHPEVFAVSVYDAGGRSLARGDDLPPVNRAGEAVLENARRTNAPSFETLIGRNSGVPTFIFGAPVQDARGGFAGIVTVSVPADRWLALLMRASGSDSAYLVGNNGHVLVHPDSAVNNAFADFSQRPSVQALLDSTAASGTLAYDSDRGRILAGYARVPELGGVIAEQRAETALAAIYKAREFALKTLLIVLALAGVPGLVVARTLAASPGRDLQYHGKP
ncbi:MAG TPA: cache domain-containing protein [Chloroflexota bacterium]|nr:cache domain-containing protein [Chloroflexota bacterium]